MEPESAAGHGGEFRVSLMDVVRSGPARAHSETLSQKMCLLDTRFVETYLLCHLQRHRTDGSFILWQGPKSPKDFAEKLRGISCHELSHG